MARARYLRWLDAVVAWLVVLVILIAESGHVRLGPAAVIAGAIVVVCALLAPLRVRWRPVSGPVGCLVSRALRPGDRAWYVRASRADLVIVTARRGLRVSIAAPELGTAEGFSVRRTRVLVVPARAA
jgi:hypothetical protein